jgi:hypothetical protein
MISVDTETTGIDIRHGARPFFVTICKPGGAQLFWEWDVDPLTREIIPQTDRYKLQDDLDEIYETIMSADGLVLQNCKFDVTALNSLDSRFGKDWPWAKTYDTLIGGHLLASNRPHNLTDMAVQYLGWDIYPYEQRVQVACNAARRIARSQREEWMIAKADLPCMPSAKETVWKYDMWLPRTLLLDMGAKQLADWIGGSEDEAIKWGSVLREYSNVDSAVTLSLMAVQIEQFKRLGLWEIYLERLKVLRVAYLIESRGITVSAKRLEEKQKEYLEESRKAERICIGIAEDMGFELTMPKAGMNKTLTTFCFSEKGLNLPIVKETGNGNPSMDKEALEEYKTRLPEKSVARLFINKLAVKRKRDTAINYMDSYRRYWCRLSSDDAETFICNCNRTCYSGKCGDCGWVHPYEGWFILYSTLNPTGTDTLRWSSQNPNEQNISKQEGFNLRYSFGPAPGREWWSFDAKNIELRLPAYESGEDALIYIFERPKDPPYFGSYHLAMFDALHPDKYAKDGKKCKDIYESTWYQWTKNGNFAMIYGCQKAKADATYRVVGAYEKIRDKFPKIAKLSDLQIAYAEKHGYVETIPDKNVNPRRGYPLLCSRTEQGGILPTVPLNYHIQGSACWWMGKAMWRVQEFFDWLNAGKKFAGQRWPGGYHLILQVHDELVPDMPSGKGKGENPYDYNLPVAKEIARLMALGGDDFGIPTPVGGEFHEHNWSEGTVLF